MGWSHYNINKRQDKIDKYIEDNNIDDLKSFLENEYYGKKKSIRAIVEETNIDYSFIKKRFDEYNIAIRDKSEASKVVPRKPFTEEHKKNMKKSFNKPECKKKRSEAQKKYWSKVPKKERTKRTSKGLSSIKNYKTSSIEIKIMKELDKLNIPYVHQKPISNGKFIADFMLPKHKIIIECNGDYWHSLPNRIERDKQIEEYVKKQ